MIFQTCTQVGVMGYIYCTKLPVNNAMVVAVVVLGTTILTGIFNLIKLKILLGVSDHKKLSLITKYEKGSRKNSITELLKVLISLLLGKRDK